MSDEWLLILGMALVTFSVRYPVMVLVSRMPLPGRVFRALRYVPPAVLAAIIVPAVVRPTGEFDLAPTNPALIGALTAVAVAWRTKNLLLTIVLGMLAFWGWRALLAGA
ncbi:MAG: AzlD domain-containing protein [Candidatus Flexifilum sp.]|jgi:branched-subunit amino acid transport protein